MLGNSIIIYIYNVLDTQERWWEMYTCILDVDMVQNAQDEPDTEKNKHPGQR